MPADVDSSTMVGARRPVGPMVPTRYRVTDRRQETVDAVTLALEPDRRADRRTGARAVHDALRVRGRRGADLGQRMPARREGALLHTIRAVGATTRALCRLEPGDSWVYAARSASAGTVVHRRRGPTCWCVGGGIGIAPLRPVVRDVLADRERFGQVAVLLGARTPADLLYADRDRHLAVAPRCPRRRHRRRRTPRVGGQRRLGHGAARTASRSHSTEPRRSCVDPR